MASFKYILALDQGTTSSRAILFDRSGNIKTIAQKEFKQIYPKAGWVEHDPHQIWDTQFRVAKEVIDKIDISKQWEPEMIFNSKINKDEMAQNYSGWVKAVEKARSNV